MQFTENEISNSLLSGLLNSRAKVWKLAKCKRILPINVNTASMSEIYSEHERMCVPNSNLQYSYFKKHLPRESEYGTGFNGQFLLVQLCRTAHVTLRCVRNVYSKI